MCVLSAHSIVYHLSANVLSSRDREKVPLKMRVTNSISYLNGSSVFGQENEDWGERYPIQTWGKTFVVCRPHAEKTESINRDRLIGTTCFGRQAQPHGASLIRQCHTCQGSAMMSQGFLAAGLATGRHCTSLTLSQKLNNILFQVII